MVENKRSNWLAPVVIAAALATLLAVYAGSYFATGKAIYDSMGRRRLAARVYPSQWHALVSLLLPQ
jgi:hypothetical protein